MNLEDESVDKKLLMSLYKKPNIKPVISSAYSSKYATTLKSLARNLILFTPEFEQKSYPTYTSFLSMLKEDDFVLTGEQTYYTPLILCTPALKMPAVEFGSVEDVANRPEIVSEMPETLEDATDVSDIKTIFEESVEDEIAKDVDAMFYSNSKADEPVSDTVLDENDELPVLDEIEPDLLTETDEQNASELEEPLQKTDLPANENKEEPQIVHDVASEPNEDELFSESDLDILDELDDDENDGETIELELGNDDIEPSTVSDDVFDAGQLPHIEDSTDVEDILEESADELSELDTLIDSDMTEAVSEDELQDLLSDGSPEPFEEAVIEESKPEAPNIPVYKTGMEENLRPDETIKVAEGNIVYHQKYGRGVVEQIITYGKKTLCSIQFDNVGRRLLDPNLADLKQA